MLLENVCFLALYRNAVLFWRTFSLLWKSVKFIVLSWKLKNYSQKQCNIDLNIQFKLNINLCWGLEKLFNIFCVNKIKHSWIQSVSELWNQTFRNLEQNNPGPNFLQYCDLASLKLFKKELISDWLWAN